MSLPLASLMTLSWLYRDTGDVDDVASLSWSILWVIVPSMVFFVAALPLGLRGGLGFGPAMLVACAATAVAYALWVWAAGALGVGL